MQKRLGWRFRQRHSIPDWIEHRFDGLRYARKVLVTRPQNLIGYWPMWEGNGVVSFDNSPQGNDGAYTGVTLAQLGIGDGRYSALYDGVNDFNNIWSPGLVADFNGAEGTLLVWSRVANAGVWTDGLNRMIASLGANATNYIQIMKTNVNNTIRIQYRAANVAEFNDTVLYGGRTDFLSFALTWSASADQVITYGMGIQYGPIKTVLGVWAGALAANNCCFGAQFTTPLLLWSGYIAHGSLYDVALTPAEILFLGTLG